MMCWALWLRMLVISALLCWALWLRVLVISALLYWALWLWVLVISGMLCWALWLRLSLSLLCCAELSDKECSFTLWFCAEHCGSESSFTLLCCVVSQSARYLCNSVLSFVTKSACCVRNFSHCDIFIQSPITCRGLWLIFCSLTYLCCSEVYDSKSVCSLCNVLY